MDVTELRNAATLAEALSIARYKQIRLTLTPRGIAIDGMLLRADDVVVEEYRAEQPWAEFDAEAGTLEALIRGVDRKLVAQWRTAEPVEEP